MVIKYSGNITKPPKQKDVNLTLFRLKACLSLLESKRVVPYIRDASGEIKIFGDR